MKEGRGGEERSGSSNSSTSSKALGEGNGQTVVGSNEWGQIPY